jgi:hypothetical protein
MPRCSSTPRASRSGCGCSSSSGPRRWRRGRIQRRSSESGAKWLGFKLTTGRTPAQGQLVRDTVGLSIDGNDVAPLLTEVAAATPGLSGRQLMQLVNGAQVFSPALHTEAALLSGATSSARVYERAPAEVFRSMLERGSDQGRSHVTARRAASCGDQDVRGA